MSEFGWLWRHEETQHALKSGRIVSLLTVATIRKKKKKTWWLCAVRVHVHVLCVCVCMRGCVTVCMCIFVFCTLSCPNGNSLMGNLGRFPQGKPAATESRYSTLINHKVYAGSFLCFHNPPTSDMDKIFNMCTWSYLWYIYIYIHTGVGHTDSKSPHFWLWKTLKFVLCSWRRWGSNLRSFDLESNALPTEPPRHPVCVYVCVHAHVCVCVHAHVCVHMCTSMCPWYITNTENL